MLNIIDTTFPVVKLEANPKFDSNKEITPIDIEVQASIDVHNNKGKDTYFVFVQAIYTNAEEVNTAIEFEVVAMGTFTISEDNQLNGIEKKLMAGRNGAGILYASIREMLALITARCPHGTFTLPTHYFVPENFLNEDEIKNLHKN